MADRRSLAEGLTEDVLDRDTAEAFVFSRSKPAPDALPEPPPAPAPLPANPTWGRVPLTSRLRADLGAALKRAALERELAGTRPYQVQEILDDALEPWLRAHGYLG